MNNRSAGAYHDLGHIALFGALDPLARFIMLQDAHVRELPSLVRELGVRAKWFEEYAWYSPPHIATNTRAASNQHWAFMDSSQTKCSKSAHLGRPSLKGGYHCSSVCVRLLKDTEVGGFSCLARVSKESAGHGRPTRAGALCISGILPISVFVVMQWSKCMPVHELLSLSCRLQAIIPCEFSLTRTCQGRSQTELSFSAGDVITVLDIIDDNWWRGELRGQVGFVAAAYVDPTPIEPGLHRAFILCLAAPPLFIKALLSLNICALLLRLPSVGHAESLQKCPT
jgi:hypothetical protein